MSISQSTDPRRTTLAELDPASLQVAPTLASFSAEADADDQDGESAILLRRSIAAVFRYKWLIAAITIAAAAAGYLLKGRYAPEYEAEGKVWIAPTNGDGTSPRGGGPVGGGGALLPSASWSDLLVSYAVVSGVVRELHLYIHAAEPRYDPLFASADVGETVRPGGYTLRVDRAHSRYALSTGQGRDERTIEQGAIGDSIGRSIGLRWAPDAAALSSASTVAFSLTTPRLAAASVQSSVRAVLPWQGNIMRVYVTGPDPWRASKIADALLRHLVQTADEFKRRNLTEVRKSIDVQLTFAERALHDADSSLEQFRKQTITLPSAPSAGQPGADATQYFQLKLAYEAAEHQRAALENTLDDIRAGKLDVQALWQVLPADGSAQDIGALLQEYAKKQSELRTELLAFTEDYQGVKDTRAAIAQLRDHAIPGMVTTMIAQLQRRERDLDGQVKNESASLATIPPRMLEDVRLSRDVDARRQLFDMLQQRSEQARLAELSVEPDLAILDAPNVPEWPISSKGRQVFLLAVVGGLGAALALALMLDRLDKRLRYVQQIPSRLKLRVLATVPHAERRRRADAENTAQLIEAFRSLRLNAMYAAAHGGPLTLAVTSAAPSEGKSFVSANLALAFAEAGFRTALIDADVRRGSLHATFDVDRCPGLVDVLRGNAALSDGLVATSHPKLSLLPCGTRDAGAPELLSSSAFLDLMDTLRHRFDVIMVDTPPLAAGMDPHALCAASGNTLFVARLAHTDGAFARQKLDVLERFPIRLMGVVANDVSTMLGFNDDYSYLPSYSIQEDDGVRTTPVRVVH